MGTFGGYDGWNVKIDKNGGFTPWASGLRSPAGLGFADEMMFYTENQGSFVGTSKLFVVQKNDYFGYPASLVDHPNYSGKTLDNWQSINKSAKKSAVNFPHSLVANSPGNPVLENSRGKFGPFSGQIFVGDQTRSNIMRLSLEKVHGQWQGVVMPFISGFDSGVMRLAFAPDGSLWAGQTGRGWASAGQEVAALQRISWDGVTQPFEIKTVKLSENGFRVKFTDTVAASHQLNSLFTVNSWYYEDTNKYGSERFSLETHLINTKLSKDNKSVFITLDGMKADRIYEIVTTVKSQEGISPSGGKAYYTVNKLL
jgi:hypothetical protein